MWNIFWYTSMVRCQQECDFSILGRQRACNGSAWAMAPGVSRPPLLMSASYYLFVLQDKQHSKARAGKGKARSTRGKACPHKGHSEHSSIVRAEKSVQQPLREVSSQRQHCHWPSPASKLLLLLLRVAKTQPNQWTKRMLNTRLTTGPQRAPGCAGMRANRKIHHHSAAGVADRDVGGVPLPSLLHFQNASDDLGNIFFWCVMPPYS